MIETFRPASWVLSIGVTTACFVDCGTKADDRDAVIMLDRIGDRASICRFKRDDG